DDINHSGTHLLGLVNELLDLSKIEMGKMELAEDLVDVSRLIADCTKLMGDAAAGAGIELVVHSEAPIPSVFADERKLKQIRMNVLSNAIKFSGSGDAVEIFATVAVSGGLQISVRDSGVGIAPEQITKVLEPFGRLRSAIESSQAGTGL